MRHLSLAILAACALILSDRPSMAADEDLSTIEGKVTYNGKPLADGVITFHLQDDQFVGAKIKDGAFRVDVDEAVPVSD